MLRKIKAIKNHFKAITMCKKCYTFYYMRSWHFERPGHLDEYIEAEVPVRFTQCPACIDQEVAYYNY